MFGVCFIHYTATEVQTCNVLNFLHFTQPQKSRGNVRPSSNYANITLRTVHCLKYI